jgi:hypothetical protein
VRGFTVNSPLKVRGFTVNSPLKVRGFTVQSTVESENELKDFSLVCMVRKQPKKLTLDMNNLSITKSNYLLEARYKLPVQAQKLVLACLGKVDSRNEIPREIVMTASEFSELMGIDIKNAHIKPQTSFINQTY